jgi:hypothetical protein
LASALRGRIGKNVVEGRRIVRPVGGCGCRGRGSSNIPIDLLVKLKGKVVPVLR